MAAYNNIFDTRNIIKETPKTGNRFLLTPDATTLNSIVLSSPLYKLLKKTSGDTKIKYIFNGNSEATDSIATVLNLSLLSATIPAFEFETGDLSHFNDTMKHLTKFTAPGDMSSVFYDYINGSATNIMMAWQSAVGFKLTGEMGYKEDYVCDMDLYIYGPNRPGVYNSPSSNQTGTVADTASNKALMQYKILNAWPRSVDVGEFSYDSTEIKKVTVQFAYDMIIPVMVDYEDAAGDGLALKTLTEPTATVSNDNSTDTVYSMKI